MRYIQWHILSTINKYLSRRSCREWMISYFLTVHSLYLCSSYLQIVKYSVSPIYRCRVYRGIGYIPVACWTPFFCPPISRILQTWRPRARYFSRNRGNSLHSIRGRQFFAKSAHRDSLCSCSLETIFREINSSLPVNAGWNTCCAMGSHARRSIDTSIVSQSRVKLIQCQCKSRLRTANFGINNIFNQIVAVWPRCPSKNEMSILTQFSPSAHLVHI